MAQVWDADNEITPETAEQLIARQFPELAPVSVQLIGVGWDNAAFRINGRYVFRFPRRRLGAELLAHEVQALPLLAPALPLPIPVPVFLGQPEGSYPYEFAGYPLIPGEPASEVDWTDKTRIANSARLATFLRALHSVPVSHETRSRAPGDELDRANILRRAPKLKERLASLAELTTGLDLPELIRIVDELATTPLRAEAPCWVHGDLYARHLLMNGDQQLSGVIDWGDVHLGDPAIDLSIIYSFLPPQARDAFWAVYGHADDNAQRRARFRAIHYGPILIAYGADVGDATIRKVGEDALRFAVS
jgi:aminoglycoside phosphotransferase (APT) family kinase protein